MPREALLVVDLEGVAGVDSPAAMLFGTPEYEAARELLTAEVNAAVEGFVAAGCTHVRVSDSHLSGSGEPNVRAESLHEAATLHHLEDWYAESLFDGVEAVACLGMHAPAGSKGFAAHTVDLSSRWSIGRRVLSESDLVLGLAAEREVPVVFVAGDDELQAHLGKRVPFVRTKRALSTVQATSAAPGEVHAALRAAARRKPVRAPALPRGALRLDFHLAACAEAAAQTGARRAGPTAVTVQGSARQRYSRALAAGHAADPLLVQSVWAKPGDAWMVEDAAALLSLPWRARRPPRLDTLAQRSLAGFLRLTEDDGDESRALRPLTLHMLQNVAPRFFRRHRLAQVLDAALEAAASVPTGLGHVADPNVLQARIDAWYLRRLRGLPHEGPPPESVRPVLQRLNVGDDVIYAWLLGELAAKAGVDARVALPERPFRGKSRTVDLYWVTHFVLLDTDYFSRPLSHPDAGEWLAALLAGAPGVVERKELDLAGELVVCLAFAGEPHAAALGTLLALLREGLRRDGSIHDEGNPDAHATATALLAFASAYEARPNR